MKRKILILTILFLFTSIVLGQKTDKQENKKTGQSIKGKITPYKGDKFNVSLVEEKGEVSPYSDEQEIDKKGCFSFENINDGHYKIIVTKEDKKSFFIPKNKSIRVTINKDNQNQEVEFQLIKGGGLEVKAELFKEKDIEKGMTIYGISSEDKNKTFSFFEDDSLKSKDKISFYGIEPGKYNIYVNIMGFGVKHIKNVEVKEGELSKAEITFNKSSKCGLKVEMKGNFNDNQHKLLYSTVELIKKDENNELSTISFGNAVVDKNGKFQIIDMQPGTYRLRVHFKVKNIITGNETEFWWGSQFVKLKAKKITKEILVLEPEFKFN